ncbi:hypothetical protein GGI20_004723, partial [Coemansia sp. BCRC 34301]
MVASVDCDVASNIAHKPPNTYKTSVDAPSPYQFIDFRAAASPGHRQGMPPIVEQIITGLTHLSELPGGSAAKYRSLPTLLLYDNAGLDLFDRITYLPEYYLTDCEID